MASASSLIQQNKNQVFFQISSFLKKYDLLLRDLTYLDGFHVRVHHKNLNHIGIFSENAFGPLLSFMTYSPTKGIIYVYETLIPENQFLIQMMISNIQTITSIPTLTLDSKIDIESPIVKFLNENQTSTIGSNMATLDDLLISNPISSSLISMKQKSYHLTLKFTVRYTPSLAGKGYETPYGLFFYPSGSFASGLPYFAPFTSSTLPVEHTAVFTVSKRYISPFVLFNINAYAKFVNEAGYECINQAGYANFRLLPACSKLNSKIVLDLRVPNSKIRTSKGKIDLVFTEIDIEGGMERAPDHCFSESYISHARTEADTSIKNYMEMNRKFYERHPPSATSIANITVFSYAGRNGSIPGCLFDCFKIPKSPEEYFLNSLKYAIQRRTMRVCRDLNHWIKGRSKEWCIAVAMDMLCIFVNHCVYITDIVDNNTDGRHLKTKIELIESFDADVRMRFCGDCEDFTREILVAVSELMYNTRWLRSGPIQLVREILNDFIFLSTLCGVSKASISFAQKNSSSIKLSGHECALAVPKYIFFKALGRNNPNHTLLSLYSQEEQNLGKGYQIYVLEGTGKLLPEPMTETKVHSDISDICNDFFSATSIEGNKPQFFYHPGSPDNFYKRFVGFLVPEFFIRFGYRGFEFLVCSENKASPGVLMRGVDFEELLNIDSNPHIQLVEAPSIPVETLHHARRIDEDNFPEIPLGYEEIPRHIQHIADTLTTVSIESIDNVDFKDVVQYQFPFNKMTQEKIDSLLRDVSKYNLRMICFPEVLMKDHFNSDLLGGFTVCIF